MQPVWVFKMISKLVRSESGFGLIQAVAALFIATIAIAGLFMASYIAQHKALGNYHYKVVLLKGLEQLEKIKYNSYKQGSKRPVIGLANGEFIIDDQNGDPVKGYIQPYTVQTRSEMIISPLVKYDIVTVKITWRDGPRYFVNSELNPNRQITLREDYFYRTIQVGP